MTAEFVHLHVHSHYSLLDCTNRPDDLCARAKELGMRAIALTDHGNLFGAVEFHQAAIAHRLKPLIGCELYVAPGSCSEKAPHPDGFERGFHLTVLAMNDEGYRNLIRLSSLGYTEGFYYNPRVDHELLAAHAPGLVALSGCLSGQAARLFLAGREKEAAAALRRFRDIFGPENFFVELQDHGLEPQKRLTAFLVERARHDGLPTVATNDVHYIAPEDASAHDALLCIGTRRLLRETDRKRYDSDQFFLKSPEEMKRRFVFDPQALARTVAIAERAEFEFRFGVLHMPVFPVPIGAGSEADHLEVLAQEGLHRRLGDVPREYAERMAAEMKVIVGKGYAGYFLIVSDFIAEAGRRGIPVGPGRGSAAGSLVAWALGITEVDPIRYGLIFERFLNPERKALPDIDVDICQARRDEVIDYVRQRYGEDRVAQIITFGTFGARAVIRDVARIHDLPMSETERLARLIPEVLKITLPDALGMVEELKKAAEGEHAALFSTALKLEGLARHASRHAAGIVIGDVPIAEIAPLYVDADENVVTQYDMNSIEPLGLLKMDILGLKTLTVIRAACDLCRPPLAPDAAGPAPYDDPEVFRLLSSGLTLGVFQLDSAGIRDLIARVKPSRFEDLAAMIALYRPGPMGLTEDFANRKHGRTPVTYAFNELEPILKETYGIILYQEQVMRIASEMAGYSLAEADELRRAMGKKKPEIMARNRAKFLDGAKARGIEPRTANELYNQIETFAGYGFNKSHAVAYAVIAYQTAWLKVHRPVEFMAVTLSHEADNRDKLALYAAECRRMGLAILPPHVNRSAALFAPEEIREGNATSAAIRCGLAAVKNAGLSACELVIEERAKGPYTSLWNFLTRLDARRVNRRAVEALVLAGAFDGLGPKKDPPSRRAMMNALPRLWERAAAERRASGSDQISLFGDAPISEEPAIEAMEEFDNLAAYELDHLGFYLNQHPLLARFPAAAFLESAAGGENQAGWSLGLVKSVEKSLDKRGRPMARVTLETIEGRADLVVFSSLFTRAAAALVEGEAVLARGRFEASGRMLCDEVTPAAAAPFQAVIRFPSGVATADLENLEARLARIRGGGCRIAIEFTEGKRRVRLKTPHRVDPAFLEGVIPEGSPATIRLSPLFST